MVVGGSDQALHGAEAGLAARVLVHVEPARLRAVRRARVRGGVRPALAPGAPEEEAVEGREEVLGPPERGEGGADGRDGADEPGAGALPRAEVGEDAPLDAARPVAIDPGAGVRAVDGRSFEFRGAGLDGAGGLIESTSREMVTILDVFATRK